MTKRAPSKFVRMLNDAVSVEELSAIPFHTVTEQRYVVSKIAPDLDQMVRQHGITNVLLGLVAVMEDRRQLFAELGASTPTALRLGWWVEQLREMRLGFYRKWGGDA